jgi:hypothetical protein
MENYPEFPVCNLNYTGELSFNIDYYSFKGLDVRYAT